MNEDLISRSELLKKALPLSLEFGEYIGEDTRATEMVFASQIKSAPAVDPVRHGRWVRFKDDDYSARIHMKCSECNAYWSDPSHVPSFRFCPNCGAKMDGSEDGG